MIISNIKRPNRPLVWIKRLMSILVLLVLISSLILIIEKIIIGDKNVTKNTLAQSESEDIGYKTNPMPNKIEPGKTKPDKTQKLDSSNSLDDIKELEASDSPDSKREKKPNNYKKTFANSIFIGDSITEGLSFYEFLEESQVIAGKGLTASKAQKKIDNTLKLNPKNIFIMFGMNDISVSKDCNVFIENYTSLIEALKKKLPDARIYIHPILPIEPKAENKFPNLTNARIDEFNQAIPNMSKEENTYYIDILPLIKDYGTDLFEADGMHFKYKFYSLWLDFIIDNYLD